MLNHLCWVGFLTCGCYVSHAIAIRLTRMQVERLDRRGLVGIYTLSSGLVPTRHQRLELTALVKDD